MSLGDCFIASRLIVPAAYIMFLGFNIIIFIVFWIWAVETKQLSLEDLDEVFESKDPKKTSLALVRQAKMMAREELAAA